MISAPQHQGEEMFMVDRCLKKFRDPAKRKGQIQERKGLKQEDLVEEGNEE